MSRMCVTREFSSREIAKNLGYSSYECVSCSEFGDYCYGHKNSCPVSDNFIVFE